MEAEVESFLNPARDISRCEVGSLPKLISRSDFQLRQGALVFTLVYYRPSSACHFPDSEYEIFAIYHDLCVEVPSLSRQYLPPLSLVLRTDVSIPTVSEERIRIL